LKNCADPPPAPIYPTRPLPFSIPSSAKKQLKLLENTDAKIKHGDHEEKARSKKIQPIADCCIFSTYYRSF